MHCANEGAEPHVTTCSACSSWLADVESDSTWQTAVRVTQRRVWFKVVAFDLLTKSCDGFGTLTKSCDGFGTPVDLVLVAGTKGGFGGGVLGAEVFRACSAA